MQHTLFMAESATQDWLRGRSMVDRVLVWAAVISTAISVTGMVVWFACVGGLL